MSQKNILRNCRPDLEFVLVRNTNKSQLKLTAVELRKMAEEFKENPIFAKFADDESCEKIFKSTDFSILIKMSDPFNLLKYNDNAPIYVKFEGEDKLNISNNKYQMAVINFLFDAPEIQRALESECENI